NFLEALVAAGDNHLPRRGVGPALDRADALWGSKVFLMRLEGQLAILHQRAIEGFHHGEVVGAGDHVPVRRARIQAASEWRGVVPQPRPDEDVLQPPVSPVPHWKSLAFLEFASSIDAPVVFGRTPRGPGCPGL